MDQTTDSLLDIVICHAALKDRSFAGSDFQISWLAEKSLMEMFWTAFLRAVAAATGMSGGRSQLLPFQKVERCWFVGKEKKWKREARG